MDPKFFKDADDKLFFNYIEPMTDREIKEKNLYYQHEQLKAITSIKNNVKFFFYLMVASAIATFLIINK